MRYQPLALMVTREGFPALHEMAEPSTPWTAEPQLTATFVPSKSWAAAFL